MLVEKEKINQIVKLSENIATISDLYEALEENNTFEVKVHIGRNSLECSLGHKLFNMASFKKEEAAELLADVSGVVANIVPPIYKKELRSVENSVRQKLSTLCIGNTDFITQENFSKFIEYFEEKKEKYFQLRDEICDNYPVIVADFLKKQEILVSGLNPAKSEYFFKEIKASIPSRKTVRSSFYMNYEIKTNCNVAIFPVDIQKSIKENMAENTKNKVKDIIGGELAKTYEKIVKIVTGEKISKKGVNSIVKLGISLSSQNIFGNAMIENIAGRLKKCKNFEDECMIIAESEEILSLIYGYCKENEMDSCLNGIESPLDKSDMLEIYDALIQD